MPKKTVYAVVPLLIGLSFAATSKSAAAQEAPKSAEHGTPAVAAETKPVSVYRLDFVVRELEDGKRLNLRNYSLSAKSRQWASLRVGSRIPIMTGESQMQYQDVGINIDCMPGEHDDQILLSTRFESSSVVAPDKTTEGAGVRSPTTPIFRQVKFSGDSLLAPGKPTVIGTLDDVATNRRYEIEVTVTKVK
ncbi:MAG: hypothetical protein LAO07_10725 [Acidobacteriia bacterium]|nr:hypothetical protein [Terriglobia bacterium]